MNLENTVRTSIDTLKKQGADHSSIFCSHQAFDELVYENDSFTLLRSVDEFNAELSVIKDQKLGSYSVNQLSPEELRRACEKTIEIATSGKADQDYSFAPKREHKSFKHGPDTADLNAMKDLISEFVHKTKELYPLVGLRSVTVKFNSANTHFANSQGASSEARKNFYVFSVLFNAQDGELSSSMNYDSFSFTDFNIDFLSPSKFGKIFEETVLHLKAKKLGETLTGSAILTPQCLLSFLSFILSHLRTSSLVAGTSRLQDKIGEKVGSSLLHLESRPQDPMFANPNYLTGDGIETENLTIFDQGVLKSYLVDLYGKNKLKLEKPSNFASRLYMPAGNQTLSEMIKEIDQGILVGRFSGGYPNANGDFSGIAKNSFFIKDGEIKQALSETMISGNLFDLMNDVYATSSEVYQNGTGHLPYLATKNITIS
jgi:PmbA protein